MKSFLLLVMDRLAPLSTSSSNESELKETLGGFSFGDFACIQIEGLVLR
jgi:hypothetical protein